MQKELTNKHGLAVDSSSDQVQQIIQRYQKILLQLKKLKTNAADSSSVSSDEESSPAFSKDVS